jgi:hypothetical protein
MPATSGNADPLRTALLFLAGLAAALGVSAQFISSDDHVKPLPLESWLAEGDQAHIRWTARVLGIELSNQQRLRARIELEVDGNELVKRRGKGFLIMAVQFNDSQDRAYQTRKAIDLSRIEDAAGKLNVTYTQDALVTPGAYRVTLGIFDTATGEHSVLQRMLNAGAIRNDPLPAAWRDLPPVELLRETDSPDNLYLPYVSGRLNLPLETRRPVRVELMVNASPSSSGQNPRTGQTNSRTRDELIPALKVISQVDVLHGALNISILDLTRRQVVFEQQEVRDLDWSTLRQALVTADPNVIDVHALENREQNAQFFVEQVGKRIAGALSREAQFNQAQPSAPQTSPAASNQPVPVLVVLSGPMTLNSGEDLHPIKASGKPAGGVFYIRYHSVAARPIPSPLDEPRRGRRVFPNLASAPAFAEPLDSLERTLKPLQPRVFDVYTPEQFRKTLAAVLSEISKL